ncbi:MAG: ROK family protein [Rhodospirillaceae bacterium]
MEVANVPMVYRIGIDLGGTKIELIALDSLGLIMDRRRVPTPQGKYEETIRVIRDLVYASEASLDLTSVSDLPSVGVGIPGAISPATGLVKNANSTCLIGRPLEKDLIGCLGRPVRIANDADCFTLSEAVDGTACNARIVFGVILGTGVGGGLAINKSIVRGPNAITGEWGHNPLPWPDHDESPGPLCYCDRYGCIETFLSGPALCRDATNKGGAWKDAEEVAEAALDGCIRAQECLERYTGRLAKALASVVNIVDPDAIVLGGGLSNIKSLYTGVRSIWGDYVFTDSVATQLYAPMYGDSSGVRGAARLWPKV